MHKGSFDLARPPRFYKQHLLLSDRVGYFTELTKRYGDFILSRGLMDFYVLNHPDLVKVVLTRTHQEFDKNSPVYGRFRNAFGKGLVTAEGVAWKRQRKLLNDTFQRRSVANFFTSIEKASMSLVEGLASHAKVGKAVPVAHLLADTSLRIIGEALFSFEFEPRLAKIRKWTESINHYSARLPIPILSQPWSPTPSNIRLRLALNGFGTFLDALLKERAKAPPKDDLLYHLYSEMERESDSGIDPNIIADEVLGIVIGGHETTANAMVWCLYEIARHPKIQHQIVDELSIRAIDYQSITALIYLKAVIQEALRLHPPFWFENRNVSQVIELGGKEIPEGTMVAFSRYSLHRHSDFWTEPESFNPERFMPGNKENSHSTYAYIPFGGGPRVCIGRHMAMLEIMTLIAVVLVNYSISIVDNHSLRTKATLTIEPSCGLPLIFKQR